MSMFMNRDPVVDTEPYLVFSNRYYVRHMSLDGQFERIIAQDFLNVVALDFDWREQRLYFMDIQQHKLFRSYMNGTGQETLIWQNLPTPEGLAVDWIGRY